MILRKSWNQLQDSRKQRECFDPEELINSMVTALSRDLYSVDSMYHVNKTHSYCRDTWIESFRKKCPTDISPERSKAALDLFRASNDDMAEVNQNWDQILKQHYRVLVKAREWMWHVLGESVELNELFERVKFTTGASLGCPYNKSSLTAKVERPLTGTASAIRWFEQYLKVDPLLKDAVRTTGYELVSASRGGTVPKNLKIDRFIAVEPTLNMFFQKGIEAMLVDRLRRIGVDLSDRQFHHRSYAFYGSIHRKTATIDFSSASDRIALELVRWLVPPQWWSLLTTFRSERISLAGEEVVLSMISSMGNAFTFPLETLVFLALMIGVQDGDFAELDKRPSEKWSAFGDDLLMDRDLVHRFFPVVESLKMSVNAEKSYYCKFLPFRESCGADFYDGRNIRALSIKPPHSTRLSSLEPWLYTITNNILKKYISYFGCLSYVYDKRFFATIAEFFDRFNLKLKVVPAYFPDDSGLKCPDIERFVREYGFNLSRIRKDQHGTYHFSYCRYVERKDAKKNYQIHYWEAQKFFTVTDIFAPGAPPNPYETRKIGGYVPAKGLSPFWSFGVGPSS